MNTKSHDNMSGPVSAFVREYSAKLSDDDDRRSFAFETGQYLLSGTAGSEALKQRRRYRILDWTSREAAPLWFRACGFEDHALTCERLAPIVDEASSRARWTAVNVIRDELWALRNAHHGALRASFVGAFIREIEVASTTTYDRDDRDEAIIAIANSIDNILGAVAGVAAASDLTVIAYSAAANASSAFATNVAFSDLAAADRVAEDLISAVEACEYIARAADFAASAAIAGVAAAYAAADEDNDIPIAITSRRWHDLYTALCAAIRDTSYRTVRERFQARSRIYRVSTCRGDVRAEVQTSAVALVRELCSMSE